ncbi:uncharacterized protein LOC120215444 [Hibiscus syriacus]|uniref:uncharacterized protein LOC120215444 n=1 Tax=Hibiscus syriacus TaxID=106335 RepID=UPI0019240C47|nr:uncharacterized protein LOC120215444 [Hibiscus syriacus]
MKKTGTVEVQEQAIEVKDEEALLSWWAGQKAELEGRIQTLEEGMTKNRGYLQRILQLVNQAAEKKDSPRSERSQPPAAAKQNKDEGKLPCLVTVLGEHEKYTFKTGEPGILAHKPVNTPPLCENQPHASLDVQKLKMGGNTTKMGESSIGEDVHSSYVFRPKIELQMFDGTNPKSWVKNVRSISQSLEYLKNCNDIVEEFNKLIQNNSVEDYHEKFDDLRSYMLQYSPFLEEWVKVHNPTTLDTAFRLAKLVELTWEVENRKLRFQPKIVSTGQSPNYKGPQTTLSQSQKGTAQNLNKSKPSLVEYRRTHGLCYKCGGKFSPGHQCKVKQLNSMEELEDTGKLEKRNNEVVTTGLDPVEGELEISINAITGQTCYNTLRIQGHISRKPLNILIDSGSTHNFISGQWSKEGVELEQTNPLTITVANGEKLYSSAMSKKLKWGIQGSQFEYDFRVLTLGGSDMVLGVDWMKKYSPLLMDFIHMTLSFQKDGEKITLRGGQNSPIIKLISDSKLQKLMEKNSDISGEIFMLSGEINTEMVPVELHDLLEEYSVVFEEPKGMPPLREHDHSITLKKGTEAVNIRPYRMPYHQKSEVEKQIKEMLPSSIIQTSKSPFTSPCLLVKKKDGSWRMCIDYRQLNALTIKNKFPIPVVEYFLDELTGAAYFSKLDLRSGYWHIRITPEDIPKTAFRTHHGHFEFKVMPFGLTNSPITFQALMNKLYDLKSHVRHLRAVLEVLKKNQLFAKRTKCFFGQKKVEYLGYIISKQGVAIDPAKIQAMQQWKLPKTLKSLRGFLGLTGYYRRFIKGYGEITKPLTIMLKKDQFQWTGESKVAFELLKNAMCHAPVLALLDFSKSFCLETDASSRGIGAVLSQEDHKALKHLLEQKLTTSIQKKGLTKLLGLDYVIQYRKGRHNLAADTLSKRDEDEVELQQMSTTVVIPTWVQEVEQSYQNDPMAVELVTKLAISNQDATDWNYSASILRYKGKVYIGQNGSLR